MRTWTTTLLLAVALLVGVTPLAGAADELAEARDRANGVWRWKDRRQTLTLTIDHGRGSTRVRKLVMLTQRDPEAGEKSLAVFLEPAEVRGTAFLQHVREGEPALQWLYLPGDGRSRQVASSARHQSFFGTDFSYADLDIIENALRWTPEEARSEKISPGASSTPAEDGWAWFELREKREDPAYQRLRVAISPGDILLRRMEMFGDRPEPTKTLSFEEIETIGTVPTALRLVLERPRRRTKTTVEISDVRYDAGLPASTFSTRALERGLDHVR